MKKWFLLFAVFAFWACSDDEVAGISTVETENAFLIRVVRGDSLPASNVVARLRPMDFVRDVNSFDEKAFGSTEMNAFVEYVTDSLGCIRVDSLSVEEASLEIIDEGEGLFAKILAKDVKVGDTASFVMEKTGALRGKIYLPDSVDFAWVQVYGTERMAKTDAEGFYEIDSLAPYEYNVRVVVGDSVIENSAVVESEESTRSNVYAFEPDSVKVLDFESGNAEFVLEELGLNAEGYLAVTDTDVVTVPAVDEPISESIEDAGAGREGKAIHWKSTGDIGIWSFFGIWICSEKHTCDLTELDSIVYYVRGSGKYFFALEALGKSNIEGKAVFDDSLETSDEWKRVCVKPSDFVEPDSDWGNFGWDAVKNSITTITYGALDESEIWIDDVTLYGIKPSAFVGVED
ncbi:hypothetical protein [Fibrobacter sp.]|uniref:hypothetical protein n=1 Tax=Fibrobacter sp. TaxID=35828 RepID=UPI00388E0FB1